MKNPHAVALGRIGGQQTSEAKKRSSAENGKKGGRPKQAPPDTFTKDSAIKDFKRFC